MNTETTPPASHPNPTDYTPKPTCPLVLLNVRAYAAYPKCINATDKNVFSMTGRIENKPPLSPCTI
jgi:hypothetical protein